MDWKIHEVCRSGEILSAATVTGRLCRVIYRECEYQRCYKGPLQTRSHSVFTVGSLNSKNGEYQFSSVCKHTLKTDILHFLSLSEHGSQGPACRPYSTTDIHIHDISAP